ncbi:hypothetical protein KY358_04240 [Candidatus Woesearchaeota archaeon]|nr:hypothetical protein [Candidatus Woesearchaeota archaeon]
MYAKRISDEKVSSKRENMERSYRLWMEKIWALRFETYSGIKAIDPKEHPSKKIKDVYDLLPSTYHFIIAKDDILAGAIRIVGLSKHGLSSDCIFPLGHFLEKLKKRQEERLPIADSSRLVVNPGSKGMNIGTYLLYTAHKYAFDKLDVQFIFTAGNPDYGGLSLIGCKKAGQKVRFKVKKDSSSRLLKEHSAVPLYMFKDDLKKPKGLIDHSKNCYIANKNKVIPLEGMMRETRFS